MAKDRKLAEEAADAEEARIIARNERRAAKLAEKEAKAIGQVVTHEVDIAGNVVLKVGGRVLKVIARVAGPAILVWQLTQCNSFAEAGEVVANEAADVISFGVAGAIREFEPKSVAEQRKEENEANAAVARRVAELPQGGDPERYSLCPGGIGWKHMKAN